MGHLPVIKYLVENHFDWGYIEYCHVPLPVFKFLITIKPTLSTRFFITQAISQKDYFSVKYLLENHPPKIEDSYSLKLFWSICFHSAMYNRNPRILKYLSQFPAWKNFGDNLLIGDIIKGGYFGVLKFLFATGKLEAKNQYYYLSSAIENNHLTLVKFLADGVLRYPPPKMLLDQFPTDKIKTYARTCNNPQIIKFLSEHGFETSDIKF